MKKLSVCTCLIVYLLLNFIEGCKKKDDPDPINYETVYPKPYFPVYPGSNWTYLKNDTETIILATEKEYKLDQYATSFSEGTWFTSGHKYYSTKVYVPIYEGVAIYGYSNVEYNTRSGWESPFL